MISNENNNDHYSSNVVKSTYSEFCKLVLIMHRFPRA